MVRVIDELPNTSSVTIKRLKSLGINSFEDLVNHFPSRYENYSVVSKISNAQPGETVTVIGEVIDAKYQVTRTSLRLQVFKLRDGTGEIEVGFYNQPYLLRLIKKGMTLSVAGVVEQYGRKLTIKPGEFEIVTPDNVLKHTGKIVPVYPQTRGLSTKTIREKMYIALKEPFPEILPPEIVDFNNLMEENSAYQEIHFPKNSENIGHAGRRLAFDELFTIQLSSLLIRKKWMSDTVGNKFRNDGKTAKALQDFIERLPFKLTKSQNSVWGEIYKDLADTKPMNRFLQGEVGSGKTVVAAIGCYYCHINGFKSLLMAPTEILAQQHYTTLKKLFAGYDVRIGIYTSSSKDLDADILVGTHALINKKINPKKIGFVVIDEQHRFGVAQRAALKEKGLNPHLLTMTATPIPRTVVLTMYGELDMSVITEMPEGRLPVKTFLVPPIKRQNGYEWIKKKIREDGAQVFIVCPLIEESEIETMKSVKATKKEYDLLKKIFSGFRLGLLHGKMKSAEKEKVMAEFKEKKFDILVTTPVVEVGVDIPAATIMVIEGAERFGLAQLHQLRGRVGRSDKQSYCFLYSSVDTADSNKRLALFASTTQGTKLAEEDLKTRGPGNIYGTKQHGFIDLKIANLNDYEMIEAAKKAAQYFASHFKIGDFPELEDRLERINQGEVSRD